MSSNIHMSYNSEIALLGIYSKAIKTYIHTKICMWMCIATSFTLWIINWKQSRGLSASEWI